MTLKQLLVARDLCKVNGMAFADCSDAELDRMLEAGSIDKIMFENAVGLEYEDIVMMRPELMEITPSVYTLVVPMNSGKYLYFVHVMADGGASVMVTSKHGTDGVTTLIMAAYHPDTGMADMTLEVPVEPDVLGRTVHVLKMVQELCGSYADVS